MSKPYIEVIDQMIEEHERAIAKLAIAREVVVAIGDVALGGAKPKGKGAAKAATIKRRVLPKGKTRDILIASLQELGRPSTTKEIVRVATTRDPKLTEKAIWNALYNAHKLGIFSRDAEGRYGLQNAEPAGAGVQQTASSAAA